MVFVQFWYIKALLWDKPWGMPQIAWGAWGWVWEGARGCSPEGLSLHGKNLINAHSPGHDFKPKTCQPKVNLNSNSNSI